MTLLVSKVWHLLHVNNNRLFRHSQCLGHSDITMTLHTQTLHHYLQVKQNEVMLIGTVSHTFLLVIQLAEYYDSILICQCKNFHW